MTAASDLPSNRLARESSPYLQQHAHNPVDWYPWGEEAMARARQEQKPILVSIGYAACHWCHVMERESFENPRVAAVMNAHFICIKVDREERPDVDLVYLEALQAMGLAGGWPLHAFLTPEAKPFYGGTYFAPRNWVQLLTSIGEAYQTSSRQELDASAEQFARALQLSDLTKHQIAATNTGLTTAEFSELLRHLISHFDRHQGGLDREPKFPLPVVWRLVLRAQQLHPNALLHEQLLLTLRTMARSGLYDQVGGGFARYAVDAGWHVPHFEKMLYDNGQLLSLYAEAYQSTGEELFRQVVQQTVGFVRRELLSPEGGFYASLDADSEGEEGRFYVFTKDELHEVLGAEEPLAAAYYNCTAAGNWEHGRNILHRPLSDFDFARAHELEPAVVASLAVDWQQRLLAYRAQRPRPALDNKLLTGWNALLLQSLLDAYRALGETNYLTLALGNAAFLQGHRRRAQGLWRTCPPTGAAIPGFLDDYAFVIQAFISLYEATFQESWLHEAATLTEYTLTHFFDPEEQQFYYADDTSETLIARRQELFDQVIPSSNAVMAHNLHRLGTHLEIARYQELAAAMLSRVQALVVQQPQHLAHWASLYAALLQPTVEIAIVGPEAEAFRRELSRRFLPQVVLAGGPAAGELPLLRQRTAPAGRTALYVCYQQRCQPPVYSVAEALALLPAPPAA